METALSSELAYYARIRAALFPIPAGSKAPTGIVGSFKHDHSSDLTQWHRWRTDNPGCNFGVVAFASRLIIVDIDTTGDRNEAWALWVDLCTAWGFPVPFTPHCQSPSGGWHVYFSLPSHVDPSQLRQPDAIKKRINIRCVGYTVAAGSTFEGKPYSLFPDVEPPHPCPDALLAHCTRSAPRATAAAPPGSRDQGDVAGLLTWLAERDAFSDYESWCQIGMALRLEYGDTGADLWELCHDATVTPETAASKFESFATDPTPDSVTLNTFLQRAHSLGWRGTVRKSTGAMFDGVAQLAAAAGATLHSQGPLPPGAPVPMMAGQEALTERCLPILSEFLLATGDAPTTPSCPDLPCLPPAMSRHGLYTPLNDAISRTFALSEMPKWKPSRVKSALAVLLLTHADVFESVRRRLEAAGLSFPIGPIKIEAKGIEDDVQRVFVKQDDWIYDAKSGLPESDNPDNVVVFLAIIGATLRWNAWLNRAEIQGFEWPVWQPVDDVVIAKLSTRAFRTKTRFRVADGFLKQALLAIAHATQFDPVIERIAALKWDQQPRLSIWLSAVCGVPCDIYHQAVGRNVIGGIVKRARRPGAKHDEVMILIGPQGYLKSTLCRTLALQEDWFLESFSFEGTPQNIVPQLFGKLVVELGELDGMHKKEVEHVKAFMSRQSDNVTLKYKAFSSDHPRRCIFIGTTNSSNPLVDVTGNRRFLPVRVTSELDIAWLQSNIEQLVAEAAVLEAAGADFSIPRDVWGEAAGHQEAARSVSDIETRLNDWFAETPHTAASFITVPDLAELSDLAGWKNLHSFRNQILRKLGFREEKPYIDGKRTNVYVRAKGDVLPRHIEHLTRFMVGRDSGGRPFVRPRTAAALGMPSMPGPAQ